MFDKIRKYTLQWTTSAALTLTGMQVFVPTVFDWIFDFMVVGLVYLAAKLAKSSTK